jgi:hypothetical protein
MEMRNSVLITLTHHGFRGKKEKSVLGVESMEFYGYELTRREVSISQDKLLTLPQMDASKGLYQLHRFLGF